MDYFFDEYEQDEINELEKRFVTCVENLMRWCSSRTHQNIRYRRWTLTYFQRWFSFRGKLDKTVTILKITTDDRFEFLHIDGLSFRYYPCNMLLRAVCSAFEIDSIKKYEKFISVLTTAAVSMV